MAWVQNLVIIGLLLVVFVLVWMIVKKKNNTSAPGGLVKAIMSTVSKHTNNPLAKSVLALLDQQKEIVHFE